MGRAARQPLKTEPFFFVAKRNAALLNFVGETTLGDDDEIMAAWNNLRASQALVKKARKRLHELLNEKQEKKGVK